VAELVPPRCAPALPVLPDPVEEGPLKADVEAEALGFEPLVLQDLLPLREEFLIEARLLDEFPRRRGIGLFGGESHCSTGSRR
jgi:hypothetical protein